MKFEQINLPDFFPFIMLIISLMGLPPIQAQETNEQIPVTWYIYTDAINTGPSPHLSMISPEEGWLGTRAQNKPSDKLIYHYKDGKWSIQPDFPVKTTITTKIDALPSGHVWVCSYSPSREETFDGLRINHYDGNKWTHTIVAPGIWPQAIDMISEHEGWIAGNTARFLHYKNGQWRHTNVNLPLDERMEKALHLSDLKMINENEGWTVGRKGLVAHYLDNQWNVIDVPEILKSSVLLALDVTTEKDLWVVSRAGIIGRFDGKRWKTFNVPKDAILWRINMISSTDGWVVGENGLILRYDGLTWKKVFSPTKNHLYDIQMFSSTEGWIIGEDIILKSIKGNYHLFEDISKKENLLMNQQLVLSTAAIDLDEDRDMDLFLMSETIPRLFKNDGQGIFVDNTDASDLVSSDKGTMNFSLGDGDGDNDLDFYLFGLRSTSNYLYINDGEGKFSVTTSKTSIEPGKGYPKSSSFIDIDTDGDLDLYISQRIAPGPKFANNNLYINNGFGEFALVDSTTGMKGYELFTLWGDLDGDLDLDAILPAWENEITLYLNDGTGKLNDSSEVSGLTTMKGDMNQANLFDVYIDGDLDLLILADSLYLFLNDGKAHFVQTDTLLNKVVNKYDFISTMSNVGDINHDGQLDFIIQPYVEEEGEKVMLYLSRENGKYEEIAPYIGLDKLTGENVLFSDLDNDGDLDLYISRGKRGHNVHLENQQNDDNYLKIRPHGILSNRKAVGAKILIYETDHLGEQAYLRGHQQVGVGSMPFGVSNLSETHFGLSAEKRYDVQVFFPGGRTVVERNVHTAQMLDVYEYTFGARHALLFYKAALRAVHFADFRIEIPKLIVVLLLLGFARFYLLERFKAKLLIKRWEVMGLIFVVYLITAGSLVSYESWINHSFQIIGFVAVLSGGLAADRQLTVWKTSRYLGHYRLHKKLGEGGMGIVYRAWDIITKRTVALKVLHPRMTEDEKSKTRFLREAQFMTELKHPNIVEIHETGEAGSRGYISMELLEGLTLSEVIKQAERLIPEMAVELFQSVCDALGYIHQKGIIHRDIKSENIFIIDRPKRGRSSLMDAISSKSHHHLRWDERVKLMDFGLARSASMLTITQADMIVGTLVYMSPEQARGKHIDERSDIYSLGVVMYEALTGTFPFSGDHEIVILQTILNQESPEPIRDFNPEVSAGLEEIVIKMLNHSPDERFQSIAEVQSALRRIITDAGDGKAETEKRKTASGITPISLSRKSMDSLAEGNVDQALLNSQLAIAELETNENSADAKQVYFNHYKVLKHSGKDDEAEEYIQKSYEHVIRESIAGDAEQSLVRDNAVDQSILIEHRACRLIEIYQNAQKLYRDGKKIDAHFLMMDCVGIIKRNLAKLEADERQEYIKEHKVNEMLEFVKKLNQ